MTDEELIARLRDAPADGLGTENLCIAAADRIEALVRQVKDEQAAKFKMRDERDAAKIAASNHADFNHTWRKRAERLEAALREIAAEASVTVHTWKNGINFKKMYEGWRKIAVERIDIARAALKGADHD